MCTSTASASRRKTPAVAARVEDARDQVDRGRVEVGEAARAAHVLRAVDVLDADEADEVGVRLVVVERQLGEPADRGDRLEVLDLERALGVADLRVGALEHGDEQPGLLAEVVVEHPLRRARALRDLVHARPRVAVLGELARGDVEDLGPRAVSVASVARWSPSCEMLTCRPIGY